MIVFSTPRAFFRPSIVATVLLFANSADASGQAMPPPSKVDLWISTHNQNRLQISWEGVPEFKGKPKPDGTTEPPKAPWPFMLYVKSIESKEAQKIVSTVFADTRVALASALVKFVQITPDNAIELPYLKSLTGIKDPSLIVIDRDFKVVGLVNEWKNFDDKGVLPLLAKASDATYPTKLAPHLGGMVELLEQAEKSWKQELRVAELQRKAGSADPAKQKALDEECDRIEKEAEKANQEIDKKFKELRASMVAKEPEIAALPTTFGSGRNKRKLTPAELEAIESFREFSSNENPLVRAAAVEDLGSIDTGAMVDFILTACNDVDPRVVEAAGRALGKMSSDESLTAMTAGLEHSDAKARTAATFGFAHVKRSWPPAVPKIVAVLKGGDDELRRAALQALANVKDPSTIDPLIDSLGDPVPALRIIAAQALGELKAEKAVPLLCLQLKSSSDWVLQKAAADALAKIRSRDSIEPLIVCFETESGILLESVYKSLVAITGEDYSFESKFWRRWWERAKADWKLPTDQQISEKKAKMAASLAQYKGPDKHKYQTIETLSKRMVFVIDVSGSMGDRITIPDDATQEEIDAFGSRVKIDIAKRELIDLLGAIGSDVEFNIITFAGSAKPWQDNLVGAGMRTSAIKFLSKLKALQPASSNNSRAPSTGDDEQKTNLYAGILSAFGFADEGAPDWKKRGKVDTVFIVTDGVPTTGQVVDVPKLIDTVTEMNRTRGLTIHLVIFDPFSAEQMKRLATNNGGQCVVRTFPTKAALPPPPPAPAPGK